MSGAWRNCQNFGDAVGTTLSSGSSVYAGVPLIALPSNIVSPPNYFPATCWATHVRGAVNIDGLICGSPVLNGTVICAIGLMKATWDAATTSWTVGDPLGMPDTPQFFYKKIEQFNYEAPAASVTPSPVTISSISIDLPCEILLRTGECLMLMISVSSNMAPATLNVYPFVSVFVCP